MTPSPTCPRCGAPLSPTQGGDGACARCLFAAGVEPAPLEVVTGGRPGPPPPSPAELAADFPQLEILELLGQGGMGVVYRARQRDLDREVALKILFVDGEEATDFAERFGREARALAALSHPGLVTVHDFGRAGRWFYLLMELVEGTNLRTLEQTGELNSAQSLDIVVQVCTALQFAHEHGVVHRDVKPENILVDLKGNVKLADFGLAKLIGRSPDPLTRTHQTMGTPQYMAPEQIEAPRTVDHRADIYSLGVVFYELLTGELPLGRFAAPSKKVQLDVRLDEVVLRTLEKEPAARYQHVSEMRTEVEGIRETPGAPPRKRSGGGQEAPPRPSEKRAWPWIAVGAAGCLCIPLSFLGLALTLGLYTSAATYEPAPSPMPPIEAVRPTTESPGPGPAPIRPEDSPPSEDLRSLLEEAEDSLNLEREQDHE